MTKITMAAVGGIDPKGLEGRKNGQNTQLQSRDFFWDSVTLFVVAAIVALTGIDVVAEFIRGSDVQCFLPNKTISIEDVKDYVNEICSGSIPPTEYLPAYIAIHAILIVAPHYIWLNLFGANLDFFFQHVSELVRTRDELSGEYAKSNYVILQQLDDAFSHTNWMYKLYLLKIGFQLLVSAIGFVVVFLYYTDFSETFTCPSGSIDESYWPLPGHQVRCVFTSLRLLSQINVLYLILLATTIICLIWSLVWLTKTHPMNLGVENIAQFTFQSGLCVKHFTPESAFVKSSAGVGRLIHSIFSSLPLYSLKSPYNIRSDYDFLTIKLYRTDGGLGYVLREVNSRRLLKRENDLEYARVNIYKRQLSHDGKRGDLQISLQWIACSNQVYYYPQLYTCIIYLSHHFCVH